MLSCGMQEFVLSIKDKTNWFVQFSKLFGTLFASDNPNVREENGTGETAPAVTERARRPCLGTRRSDRQDRDAGTSRKRTRAFGKYYNKTVSSAISNARFQETGKIATDSLWTCWRKNVFVMHEILNTGKQ